MIHIPQALIRFTYCVSNYLWVWYARFAKWRREAIERSRQHSATFNGLLDTVSVSPIAQNVFEPLPFQAKGV
jgi:hypothetical protein